MAEMTGAAEDEFLLKWHDHHQSFFLLVEELVMREQLTDVTLACGSGEDQQLLSAHSLMLSVCSPYFRTLLSENRHKEKHHIIHLHGVSARHLQQLLVYMYRGEISISQEDLAPLIETARCLQIKGLAMAQPNVNIVQSPSSKKRPISQVSPVSSGENSSPSLSSSNKQKKTKKQRPSSPLSISTTEEASSIPSQDPVMETPRGEKPPDGDADDYLGDFPLSGFGQSEPFGKNDQISPSGVSLPLLPKPLSILKTAETRTYLSKLIWLGNGGRRPQYGNPETKPSWWPQHILPWEDMKKMGGRKSQELSHINYTEILKQCLSAGYEYFGYDPTTYFAHDGEESFSGGDCSYVIEDGAGEAEPGETEPALEIDLDQVEAGKKELKDELESCGKTVGGRSEQGGILCK